jgi:hypothetical protein
VYATLMGSDAVEPSGRAEGGTRPGRTRKKPKDLSAYDRKECGSVMENHGILHHYRIR